MDLRAANSGGACINIWGGGKGGQKHFLGVKNVKNVCEACTNLSFLC